MLRATVCIFGNFLTDIGSWIGGFFADAIRSSVIDSVRWMTNLTTNSMSKTLDNAISQVSETPQSFNPGIFTILETFTNQVLVPIGILILSVLLFYELIDTLLDKNSTNDTVNIQWFIKWSIKFVLGIFIVTNTWGIVNGIMEFLAGVTRWGATVIQGSAIDNSANLMAQIEAELATAGFGTLISTFVGVLIGRVLMWILNLFIYYVLIARMIEIYLIISMSPIAMSTFVNKEWNVGNNYIKKLIAKGVQALLIVVILAMSGAIQGVVLSQSYGSDAWGLIGAMLITYVVVAMMMFKTGSIANSIVGAN